MRGTPSVRALDSGSHLGRKYRRSRSVSGLPQRQEKSSVALPHILRPADIRVQKSHRAQVDGVLQGL